MALGLFRIGWEDSETAFLFFQQSGDLLYQFQQFWAVLLSRRKSAQFLPAFQLLTLHMRRTLLSYASCVRPKATMFAAKI